ncbi:MAG: lysophospholipid acyltransferase family protein [Armatimonadetes bacterium]|nr:lysophospholipid acyltransferase family protein [Armatimonadota bacterium]
MEERIVGIHTDPRLAYKARKSRLRRFGERVLVRTIAVTVYPLLWALPLPALRGIARVMAVLGRLTSPARTRLADENIRGVYGASITDAEVLRIRNGAALNAFKTMAELLKLRWLTDDQVRALTRIEGREHLDAALARGNGVCIVTAHLGNWELAAAAFAVAGYPMNVVARDADDPVMRELINGSRRSKGINVFGRQDVRQLVKILRGNEIVALVPDQHASEAAVRIKFLGRVADTHTGPATFALRLGTAIVPVFAVRQPDDTIRVEVHPALELPNTGDRQSDILASTQMINDALGEGILKHPEQWLWFHNRWKAEKQIASSGS